MEKITPVSYLQSDSKWKTKPYRVVGKETSTIGSAGCGPTSAAMVIATLADPSVTPVETCKWSMANGFKAVNQGTYYTYFVPQLAKYGIKCTRLNSSNIYHQPNNAVHDIALTSLKAGDWLICCMGPGNWTKGGHFILVYAYEDGKVLINDPASKAATRVKNTWNKLKNEVKYYFVITVPGNKDENAVDVTVEESEDLYWGICTGNNVNLRAGMGKDTRSLGKVNSGEGMTCDPNASSKNWVKVYHAGLKMSGYVSARYIQKQENSKKKEVKVANTKVDKSNELYWGICTGNNVNLREGMSTNTRSIGKVNNGEGMTCNPAESSDSWIKVYHAGLNKTGYVSARYIKR